MTRTDMPSPHGRVHGLDALRASALLLGIVLHALGPFLPMEGWLVNDRHSAPWSDDVVYVIHLFRMTLFMLLAGYFGRMLLRRRGPARYLRDRASRVLLPFIVLWPVAVGPLLVFGMLAIARGQQSALPDDEFTLLTILAPGHLWFLLTLFECVAITLLIRHIAYRTLGAHRCEQITHRIGETLTRPGGVVLAAAPYFAAVLSQGPGHATGLDTPATIVPTVSAILAYLGAFLTGWLIHGQPQSLAGLARRWPAHLIAAVALTAVGLSPIHSHLSFPAEAAVTALAGWTWTFGLMGLSLRLITRERPAIRYLADASYWMYLMHLPILTGVAFLIADWDWPVPVKLTGTLIVTTAILLLSYDVLVRQSRLGQWLNGRKYPSLLFTARVPKQAARKDLVS